LRKDIVPPGTECWDSGERTSPRVRLYTLIGYHRCGALSREIFTGVAQEFFNWVIGSLKSSSRYSPGQDDALGDLHLEGQCLLRGHPNKQYADRVRLKGLRCGPSSGWDRAVRACTQ